MDKSGKTNLTLEKRSVQLIKPADSTQPKPTLTNVAICTGCHGCGGPTSPTDPVVDPSPMRMY